MSRINLANNDSYVRSVIFLLEAQEGAQRKPCSYLAVPHNDVVRV